MLLGSYVTFINQFPYELVVEVPRIHQNPESVRFNMVPAKCKMGPSKTKQMGPSKTLGTILGPSPLFRGSILTCVAVPNAYQFVK